MRCHKRMKHRKETKIIEWTNFAEYQKMDQSSFWNVPEDEFEVSNPPQRVPTSIFLSEMSQHLWIPILWPKLLFGVERKKKVSYTLRVIHFNTSHLSTPHGGSDLLLAPKALHTRLEFDHSDQILCHLLIVAEKMPPGALLINRRHQIS